MRTVAVFLTLALILSAGSAGATAPCGDLATYPVRFAILGDRTGGHQEGIYPSVVAEVARMRPDFVMTVGDMIEGYTSDTARLRAEWDEYCAIVAPLTGLIHYTPGNHDITYDGMEPTYRQRIGPPYYSFDVRGVHFVVMDNSRWESFAEMPKEQIAWLKEDLAGHQDACYTLVFMHKPFWYRGVAAGHADPLHEIFKQYGVDAVFTGHFHEYFSGTYDGILYTSFGSSGADALDRPEGYRYQFGWVTIDGDGVHPVPIKRSAVGAWGMRPVEDMRAANRVAAMGLTFDRPLFADAHMHSRASTVRVRLVNEMSTAPYTDTLHWKVPEGWTIEPQAIAFSVAPHDTTVADFSVIPAEKLNPLPYVWTSLPYGEGETEQIVKRVNIGREVICNRAGGDITIDGKLDEPCWSKPVTVLYGYDGKVSPQDSTAFYFAYDHDNLYMGAYCREARIDSMKAELTERDSKVYMEDAVGVMFSPDSDGGNAYQVYVNPLGTICDQRLSQAWDGYWIGDTPWNGEYQVQTSRGSDYYVIELRIPLAQFDLVPRPGNRWRVNFRRKQFRLQSAAALQNPWSYNPESFGELVFQ